MTKNEWQTRRHPNQMQSLSQQLDEAESHVEQVESLVEKATEAISTCLDHQRSLQLKLTDLELRSRRNSIQVFGLGEAEESDSVSHFMEKFLRSHCIYRRTWT